MYKTSGVTRSAIIAGKLAALNHVTQGLEITTPSSSANLRHSRF